MTLPTRSSAVSVSHRRASVEPITSSVSPLLFAAMLRVVVLVCHDEVVRNLTRLLGLDDALEQPFTLGLGRFDLDVRDLG